MALLTLDKSLIWHPFTQEKTADERICIVRGEGAYLFDESGKKYLDLISSWWVNLHGHGRSEIAEAIYRQARSLEHVMFAGFTHQPAVELCQKIKKILPIDGLNKFFFSDNGSTAVEISMKIAYQFWKNQGFEKKVFLALEGGYHGDTFGTMSASKSSNFHNQFENFFYEFEFISVVYFSQKSDLELVMNQESVILQKLELYLQNNHSRISAFLAEPLVQGANGMKMYRAEFLNKIVLLVKSYNILIILDEVMTGFGRIGRTFAFNHCDFIPDMICLSKGLTGGFLPMALTITSDEIYDVFLDNDYSKSLAHGHSYTANPLGCAAGIASIDLLLREETQNQIQKLSVCHLRGLQLLNDEFVENKRSLGTISAFSFRDCVDFSKIRSVFLKNSLVLRPLGRECYVLPPYCIDLNDLLNAYKRVNEILDDLHRKIV